MGRKHMIEIHDHPACPESIRNGMRSFLQFFSDTFPMFSNIVPLLTRAMAASGTTAVVDLCSGSGGPWLKLIRRFSRNGAPLSRITMSDLHPDPAASQYMERMTQGLVRYIPKAVDASDFPRNLIGFRTIFSSFHHFDPPMAKSILRHAMKHRVGLGVFEATQRSAWSVLCVAAISIVVSFSTAPIIYPFRWSNLFWTYVIPVLPLIVAYDGIISCMKTYTHEELEEMVADLQKPGYRWTISRISSLWSPFGVTCLIGHPE